MEIPSKVASFDGLMKGLSAHPCAEVLDQFAAEVQHLLHARQEVDLSYAILQQLKLAQSKMNKKDPMRAWMAA
jgi:hypothetical protein